MASPEARKHNLDVLRVFMESHSPPLSAILLPLEEALQGDHVSKWGKMLQLVSGFTGTAGFAVITMERSILWTEKCYIRASREKMSNDWEFMSVGVDATTETWLVNNLPSGAFIGVNSWMISVDFALVYRKLLSNNDKHLVETSFDSICNLFLEDEEHVTGVEFLSLHPSNSLIVSERVKMLRERLVENRIDAIIITTIDQVAWLLNVSEDMKCHSYAIVTLEDAFLYLDKSRVTKEVQDYVKSNGIHIREYDFLQSDVTLLADGQLKTSSVDMLAQNCREDVDPQVWIDPTSCCLAIYSKLKSYNVCMRQSPIAFAEIMEETWTDSIWTYRGKMINNTKVLSEVETQPPGEGTCVFYASVAALQACLHLKGESPGKLSVDFVVQQYKNRLTERANCGKLELICRILQDTGTIVECDFGSDKEDTSKRYRISEYVVFDPRSKQSLGNALDHMKDEGPLVCSYFHNHRWISNPTSKAIIADDPYNRCYNVHKGFFSSHAVEVPGFGAEVLPYFEFKDSGGLTIHKDGFGRILPSALQELYGFRIFVEGNKKARRG